MLQTETYTFKAQKPELAEAWVHHLQCCIEGIQEEKMRLTSGSLSQVSERPSHLRLMPRLLCACQPFSLLLSLCVRLSLPPPQRMEAPDENKQGDEHPSVIAVPDSSTKRLFWACMLPMLLCFYFTIPDVRQEQWYRGRWYIVTMANAVVWLALLAQGMMLAAESCGCLMEIDPDLMGLSVTAIGTSLPNLFASVLVARQGLGNMAVSNAFGSNTFNIFIALGVPWLIGCLRSEDGSYQVNKGHIFGTCLILVGVLTLFLFGLGAARMKLTPTVGILYIVTYLIFITYLILSEPRIRLLPELPV